MKPAFFVLWLACAWLLPERAGAQLFRLPTANHALLEPNGGEKFFVGTVGKPWTSGMFGCVRSEGWHMHEGLDIKCLQRDKKGEPIDPVMATADGTVAYFSNQPALSNYGRYVVLRHHIEGIEIYSLYAHLREIRADLKIGQSVSGGERIATMGRSTNTRQGISKDRAHVHFELDLLLNERFASWYKTAFADQRNDHGNWNGQNLAGLDAREILLQQAAAGGKFSLRQCIQNQPELCRVLVPGRRLGWLQRYPTLARRNPLTEREGIAAYEIALNFNGVPFQVTPRAGSETKGRNGPRLLSVNEGEYEQHHCRRLVARRAGHWELTPTGSRLLELLTY
ncbi:MAG: M23 family metallopeptidase [Verrucomicrobia bacterium]|nr:M23 family metallopeptidase [Verrucomicrobiota bacterium]